MKNESASTVIQYSEIEMSDRIIPLFEQEPRVLVQETVTELSLEEKISRTEAVIHKLLSEGDHLLIATSFGKDSACMLNIFLQAMRSFVEKHGCAPECRVINSCTLIENPLMDHYARMEAEKVKRYCEKHRIPVIMDIVEPNLSNNYLVNIIGGRTIAVDAANDSKCSIMMKVDPINKHKRKVFKEYGAKNVITLVGTRFDESKERARKMKERGDSFFDVSVNKMGDRVLSPIADFSLDDVFFYIGYVRAEKFECYSNFDDLVQVYRDANGGDCMVNIYSGGSASNAPCGARTGCFLCLRSEDKSMANMLEEPKNSFMKPLFELRAYIKACQYDSSKRNWLSRTVNEDGTINIAPNSYSPAYCEELLRIVLSIQMRENRAASRLEIEPRFMLLRLEDVIGIEVLWSRYGYHQSAAAIKIFDEVVNQDKGCHIQEDYPVYFHKNFTRVTKAVPFADESFGSYIYGLRDIEAITAGCERTVVKMNGKIFTDVNTDIEFSVDAEGAELFFCFELDNFLSKYADSGFCPTQVYHYFMRLGTVSLHKGGHSENDRMLQLANQIHRHNLVGVLNDPEKLISTLTGCVTELSALHTPVQAALF